MGTKRWLTLREAAAALGVHPATLRSWADAGVIPSFRTPGGHRRFALEDVEAFLLSRSQGSSMAILPRSQAHVVERALEMARTRLPHARQQGAPWYEAFDEEVRRRKRQEGRLLFSLAMQYVSKPEERERILARARALGYRYGEDSVRYGISLTDTLKAIFFFQKALLDTLEAGGDLENGQSPADVRITCGVEEFIHEILYATVEGYEQTLRRSLTQESAA